MWNSNSKDPRLVELEEREQELRSLASQRNEEIDMYMREKDRKLNEQDFLIRAQMDKISQLQESAGQQSRLIQEYESRFDQVRQAISDEQDRHRNEQNALHADLRDWQDRCSSLESKVQELTSECSDLVSKLRGQQWQLDQDLKRGQRDLQAQIDRASTEKQNYLKDLERAKDDLIERHSQQLQQQQKEANRTESLLQDRISSLEKELAKAQVDQLHHRQTAEDLRLKADQLTQKNERLRLDLFEAGDMERKQSLQLQLEVQSLRSQLAVASEFSQKQQAEQAAKLVKSAQDQERLQLEVEKLQERIKHASLTQSENQEMEVSKVRIGLERQMEALHDTVQELQSEREHLRGKVQKQQLQLKDSEREQRKELQLLSQKLQETEDAFEHQLREMRCTLQLKSKEILCLREELDETQSKLNSKMQESRHLNVQLSLMTSKYEEAMQDLERTQLHQTQQAQGDKELAAESKELKELVQTLRIENQGLQQALAFARELCEDQIQARETKISPLHSSRREQQTFETNEASAMPLSPSMQQRLEELKLENNGLRSRLAELSAQLMKNNQMQRSAENKFYSQREEKDRDIAHYQEVILQLEQALTGLQHQLADKDRQIQQLKFEREKILEVSQNLKVQLINSEKKARDGESDKADSFIKEQREVNQDIEVCLSNNTTDFQKLKKGIRDSSCDSEQRQSRPIEPYSRNQSQDYSHVQQMNMFDPRMSNISDLSQLKMGSPHSAKLKGFVSPKSPTQPKVIVEEETNSEQDCSNIRLDQPQPSRFHQQSTQARTAALQRLQHLKQTYAQVDSLFPTSQDLVKPSE